MKDWYSVGQFSKKTGLSVKALHLYEEKGLLLPHHKGDNGYRYYSDSQTLKALKIFEFKSLGFSLSEIAALIQIDENVDLAKVIFGLEARLSLVDRQESSLRNQKNQIQSILTSLKKKSVPLKAQDRRAVMSIFGNISSVVTGAEALEKTAKFVQAHFQQAGIGVPVFQWSENFQSDQAKPYILIVEEQNLAADGIREIHPDVILIKNMSDASESLKITYMNLFEDIGPHVNTVLNADDRASVNLAGDAVVQKGRIFYYSKNSGVRDQIQKIGGVVCHGDDVEVFGFNFDPEILKLKMKTILPLRDEFSYISSIGAVLTAGLESARLNQV